MKKCIHETKSQVQITLDPLEALNEKFVILLTRINRPIIHVGYHTYIHTYTMIWNSRRHGHTFATQRLYNRRHRTFQNQLHS